MNKTLLGILLLLVFCVGQTSMAADVLNADVAGVKLRMSVTEVEAAMTAREFTERGRSRAPDFGQAAQQENRVGVNPSEYAGVQQIIFETDFEKMQIRFVPMPNGMRVASVAYTFFGPGSSEDMTKGVLAKYGKPDYVNRSLNVWGDELNPYNRQEPSLEYSAGGRGFARARVGSLTLADPVLRQKSKDEIKKAATGMGGKKPRF